MSSGAKIIVAPKSPPIVCTLIDYSAGGACLQLFPMVTLPNHFLNFSTAPLERSVGSFGVAEFVLASHSNWGLTLLIRLASGALASFFDHFETAPTHKAPVGPKIITFDIGSDPVEDHSRVALPAVNRR